MDNAFLSGVLAIFTLLPMNATVVAHRQARDSPQRLDCDAIVEDQVRELKLHPREISQFLSSVQEVDTPIAYCNGMGDDNEWYSFTSKEKNEAAIDWVKRIQVLERLLNVKLSADWLGSTNVDASEEPLLESRRNALLLRNGKCRPYYDWQTQGIYFIPPVDTQAQFIKRIRALAKKRHLI